MVRGCLCGHPKKTPGSGGGALVARDVARSVKRWHFIYLAPGCSASDRPCRPCSSPNPSRPWLAACAPTVAVRRSRAAMEVPLRSLCFNPGRAKALQWPRASADLDAATSGLSLRLASLPLPLLLLLTQTSPDRHPPPQHGRQSRASQPEPRDADQGRARGHAHDRQHVASEAPSIR